MIESNQRLTDNVFFTKFAHTSLPFCDIHEENQSQNQITELDIAWHNEDGAKINIAESLFDDTKYHFIPLPAQPHHFNSKSITHQEEARSTMSPQIDNTFFIQNTRNKHMNPKPRSLLRPTQIKDYKLVRDDCDSEDEVISEMRSLTVRPANKEDQSDSLNHKN